MSRTLVVIFLFISSALALNSMVKIYEDGNYRVIKANGLPNHQHGDFPNAGNPNRISEQKYTFKVALKPTKNSSHRFYERSLFGVALNGIPFDPGTAEFYQNDRRSGWRYEALSGKLNLGIDLSNAHVQPTGAYHYHGIPKQIITKKPMQHIGYAADGFPIYYDSSFKSSYKMKSATRPSGPGGKHDGTFVADYEFVSGAGNLKECNHIYKKTKEYPKGTWLYALTKTFPFVPRCHIGSADSSFEHSGGGGRGRGRGGRGHRPPPHHHGHPPPRNNQ